MSIVVVNTVKQLSVNVRPHRYNICPEKQQQQNSIAYTKALCRKVASRSWRYLFSEANYIDSLKSDGHLTYLRGILPRRSLSIAHDNMMRISDSVSLLQNGHARAASAFLAKRSLWDLSCETSNLILSKQFLAFMCFKSCKNGDIVKLDLNVLYISFINTYGIRTLLFVFGNKSVLKFFEECFLISNTLVFPCMVKAILI